jgi:2-oxo-4-hydroxy-4-carboxy--5-ureidoimidazoline (OHCU) decarboxylase
MIADIIVKKLHTRSSGRHALVRAHPRLSGDAGASGRVSSGGEEAVSGLGNEEVTDLQPHAR